MEHQRVRATPAEPLRLAVYLPNLLYGGCERQVSYLLAGLDRSRFEPLLVVNESAGSFRSEVDRAAIPTISLEKTARWQLGAYLNRLPSVLRNQRADIVFTTAGTPDIAAAVVKRASRVAKLVWRIGATRVDYSQYPWSTRAIDWARRKLAHRADLVIFNSHAALSQWHESGAAGNTVVIPNGFDTNRFRPDRDGGMRVRGEWGVAPGQTLIGAVGRLDPQKDYPTMIRAAALFARSRKEAVFVCVGPGSEEARASTLAAVETAGLSARFRLAGPRNDMAAVYSAMDVFSTSSAFGEGTQNSLGEAMSCERRCVATDCGDARRMLGDAGWVVPTRDAAALARGWSDALCADPAEAGAAARRRIVESLGLDEMVRRTEQALCSLF